MADYEDVKDRIKQFITDQGYELGKYGYVTHNCGIASGCLLVKPHYSPIDGGHTVAVYPDRVTSYVCHYPSNYNDWHSQGTYPYKTTEELAELLRKFCERPTGEAWG